MNIDKITGNLTNIKYSKISGEIKLEITIEREMANAAFERIGGFPNPESNTMVQVSVIQEGG